MKSLEEANHSLKMTLLNSGPAMEEPSALLRSDVFNITVFPAKDASTVTLILQGDEATESNQKRLIALLENRLETRHGSKPHIDYEISADDSAQNPDDAPWSDDARGSGGLIILSFATEDDKMPVPINAMHRTIMDVLNPLLTHVKQGKSVSEGLTMMTSPSYHVQAESVQQHQTLSLDEATFKNAIGELFHSWLSGEEITVLKNTLFSRLNSYPGKGDKMPGEVEIIKKVAPLLTPYFKT